MRTPALTVAFGAVVAAACGLSVKGELDLTTGDAGPTPGVDGSPGVDAGVPTDGGGDGDAPTPACDSGLATGAVLLPSDGGACPVGTTEKIVQIDPQASDGACACAACTVTNQGTCAGPNFSWTYSNSASCSMGPTAYDVTADNACIEVFQNNTQLFTHNRWERYPTGGACSAAPVPTDAGVSSTPLRQCVPDPSACPVPSSSDRVCIPAPADGGTCSGTFSAAVVVGDGPSVSCGPCTCTATGQCHVEYHADDACTSKQYERNADGTCATTGTPSIQRIKVYPTAVVCSATPGAATASLTNAKTYCCTP